AAPGPSLDESALACLGAGESDAVRRLRADAFNRATALPATTGLEEDWRRTDPRRFDFGSLPSAPAPEAAEPGEPGGMDSCFDVVVRIDGDRWSVADRSGALAGGAVELRPLSEALSRDPDGVERLWNSTPGPRPDDRFELLARAFHTLALHLRVAAGASLDRGVLLHWREPPGQRFIPAVLIDVGDGASIGVTEIVESAGAGPAISLGLTRFAVGAGGKLRLTHIQRADAGSVRMGFTHGSLAAGASLDAVTVHAGADLVRTRFSTDAAGRGASARVGGLFFAAAGQHVDQQTLQIHSSPETTSDLLYKGAVRDDGHSIYRGLIAVSRGAVRINAYQRNNNIVLNDGARADSLPGLLIDADDLKCSHGATIGSVDPAQIFYLRSRGLNESEARRLILEGFFEEITSRLAVPALRDQVRALLGSHLMS
ncbi:MAG: Fe-S cluster assembly protein SufD, partial [Verrucomicrobia bacterium]|nr:Fe-S cluster assembly protein SufD [Verrucomicrobiota bacterium]